MNKRQLFKLQVKSVLSCDTKSFKCLCFQVFHLETDTREAGFATPKYCL